MGALACMELLSRRLQQYAEACALGVNSFNWASAKHLSSSSSSLDLVPPEMRSYCRSSQWGGAGARKLTSETKDTRSCRRTWCGGVAAAAALVGRHSGGSVGHGDEGTGNGEERRRG